MAKYCAMVVTLTVLLASPVLADEILINLEWRMTPQTVDIGDSVNVGLYAVCDPGETQLLRAADVKFTWEPTYLQFLGVNNALPGTIPALASDLPANDPYGLNGPTPPPTDGDGYYRWWANLGSPVTVTDAGALMTTFQFAALAQTPPAGTLVSVVKDNPSDPLSLSRVLGSAEAGTIVTGTLGSAVIHVLPEPATLSLLAAAGLLRRRR